MDAAGFPAERKENLVENQLQKLLKARKFIYLDGAMGTMLQKRGLKPGQRPELFILEHPEIVAEIHRQYLDSGSDILYACTFGANAHKLDGTGVSPAQVVQAAVAAAKEAVEGSGREALIALDVGPIGEMLEPGGTLRFEDAYAIFKEVLEAGAAAGADLAAFETMTDLAEVRAGVLAAKENTSLPVMATMTFEQGGRTFTGCLAEAMAYTLSGMGVDALGVNCSLGPKEVLPIVEKIAATTGLPLIVKPNAGLPDPLDNHYSVTPELFAQQMKPFAALGIRFAGGCCGTSPDYIRALKAALEPLPCPVRKASAPPAVCTAGQVLPLTGVHMAGERINPTGKAGLSAALAEGDMEPLVDLAFDQSDAGAEILDVNVSAPGVDEPAAMAAAVKAIQEVRPLPLLLDSACPVALEAGLRAFQGVGILNSVSGKAEDLKKLLPIAKKYGAFLVGMAIDEGGIPPAAEGRLAVARRILQAALDAGIPKEKVLIDCLALSSAIAPAEETLRAVRLVKEELGLKTVLGISNVSFGLPGREALNSAFLAAALECGLDLPILNPSSAPAMDALAAFRTLHGLDGTDGG